MICSFHKYKSINKKLSNKNNEYFDLLVSLPFNENKKEVDLIIDNFISDES